MKPFVSFFIKFISYALILFFVAQIIATDAQLQSFKENSNTEHAQDILLLISTILCLYIGYHYSKIKSLTYTLATLLFISFIREMDAFFDAVLFHGAWFYIALATLVIYFATMFKNLKTIPSELALIVNQSAAGLVTIGLLIIHVFSRLYGRKKMWKALMGEDKFIRIVKDASEEGLELLGYSIIFIGVIELLLYARKHFK